MATTVTALEIINAANSELGLPNITQSVSTTETLGAQSLALLNALGLELVKIHDWQFLLKTMIFIGDGGVSQFDLPEDWSRQVNQTQWDKTNRRPMCGPDSPQIWSWLQFGIVSVGVYFRYRIADNLFEVFPVPAMDQELTLFYISENWVKSPIDEPLDYTAKKITNLREIPMFDTRLLVSGLKVKLWGAKGFDTTILQSEFSAILQACKGQSQGARAIDLTGWNGNPLINWNNVPDGTYYGS